GRGPAPRQGLCGARVLVDRQRGSPHLQVRPHPSVEGAQGGPVADRGASQSRRPASPKGPRDAHGGWGGCGGRPHRVRQGVSDPQASETMRTITITKKQEVEVSTLQVRAGVRYWCDATVNGVEGDEDAHGPDSDMGIPCREGEDWCPAINIETGTIEGWPKG